MFTVGDQEYNELSVGRRGLHPRPAKCDLGQIRMQNGEPDGDPVVVVTRSTYRFLLVIVDSILREIDGAGLPD